MDAGIMVEDLLNFTLGAVEEDYHYDENTLKATSSSATSESLDPDASISEHAEEELEWLSNKDAFPSVETYFDNLNPDPSIAPNQHSPVSVLNPSTTTAAISNHSSITSRPNSILAPPCCPTKPRSKRRRPRRLTASADLADHQYRCRSRAAAKNPKRRLPVAVPLKAPQIERRCQHCGAEQTPQWRAGPMGPKTLCNACGVRYKSGRLVPEYRPASSPTFSSSLHSNSHRKVMEMRRQKQMG